MCAMFNRPGKFRLRAQGFYCRLVRWASFAPACTKILHFEKERGVQHKLYHLCKQFRHREPLLIHFRNDGPLLKSKFSDINHGPNLASRPFYGHQLGLLTLVCTGQYTQKHFGPSCLLEKSFVDSNNAAFVHSCSGFFFFFFLRSAFRALSAKYAEFSTHEVDCISNNQGICKPLGLKT